MNITDVVLINDCGCEIARESITNDRSYSDIIRSWELYPGDRIEIVESWTEI